MQTRFQPYPGIRTITTYSKPTTTVTPQVVSNGVESFRVYQDVKNGDRKTINPHSFAKYAYTEMAGMTFNGSDSNWTLIEGQNIENNTDVLQSLSFSTIAYNNAIASLWEQVRDTSMDLSIDIFESPKTRKMVSDFARGIRAYKDTWDRMKKANPRDLGNLWLQYQYGIHPICQTVYDTLHEVMSDEKEAYRTIKARGYEHQSWKDSTSIPGGTKVVSTTQKFRCEIVGVFAPAHSAVQQLAAYTSLNPVAWAWELLPYSFVADWFVDVGGYMQSLEAALIYGPTFIRGYVTQGYKADRVVTKNWSYSLGADSVSTGRLSATNYLSGKQRSILGSYPLPRLPTFQPSLGPKRLLSAASLLAQQVKSWEVRLPREHRFR